MTDTSRRDPIPITIAYGDGIGPEIMDAVLRILDAAGAPLRYERVEIGEAQFAAGHSSGIPPEAWKTIRRNRALLKAPITTPLGGGYKSLNVTIRKALNLFANVRPTMSYAPFVPAGHPGVDLVIVRENEEDLYAGIEHRQTAEVTQALKLITRPGTERIIRYAFEYARAYGRRKVVCMTKNNIMKLTDGLFARVFEAVAEEYPELKAEHQIIDIGAARLASQPERFDVIVTLNLYGDILSDIAAQVAGSVGLAGSANVGPRMAMFEAIHGSAPDIAGRGVANPSGLLNGATQMLVHLGLHELAGTIRNAWLCTLEDGIHTADIYRPQLSEREVGTEDFANALIERLGQRPTELQPVDYRAGGVRMPEPGVAPRAEKRLVGVDVFLEWPAATSAADRDPNRLGRGLEDAAPSGWKLRLVTNRGVKVYPGGLPETFLTDHWRCRFMPASSSGDAAAPAVPDAGARSAGTTFDAVLELLAKLHRARFDIVKTEHLYDFDGRPGYSLGAGE